MSPNPPKRKKDLNMAEGKRISKQLLAAILAAAGLSVAGANAQANECSLKSPEIDEATSEKIILGLIDRDGVDLDVILNATSMDQLTAAQQAQLLKWIQETAKKIQIIAPLA
jgi:hypothetical protein